jgi:predicted metal-dependent phosphoesterase TrpH
MGKAILHIHTTYSDGLATVDEILDEVERNSDIDIVGFTDHDDVRAFAHALRWKAEHPGSRVQPLWGVELTAWGFKHLLAYVFRPPFPAQSFPRFLPLARAVRAIKAAGGWCIVPHVDSFWIGVGRHRMYREARRLGIDGLELYTPVLKAERSIRKLKRANDGHGLLELGGSDAHHLEDLYQVIVEFPGRTLADLEAAFRDRTATARWGDPGPPVPLRRQLRQHTRALVVLPTLQVQSWMERKLRERRLRAG